MVDQTGASRQRRRDLVDGQDVSEQATAQARPRTRATKKPIATMAQFTSWQQWRGQKCPKQWCGGATAKEKMVRTGDVWQKIWSRHHCGQCKWGTSTAHALLCLLPSSHVCFFCCSLLFVVVRCCSLLFFVVLGKQANFHYANWLASRTHGSTAHFKTGLAGDTRKGWQ